MGSRSQSKLTGEDDREPLACCHFSFCYAKLCEILSKWVLKDMLDPLHAFPRFSHPWFAPRKVIGPDYLLGNQKRFPASFKRGYVLLASFTAVGMLSMPSPVLQAKPAVGPLGHERSPPWPNTISLVPHVRAQCQCARHLTVGF